MKRSSLSQERSYIRPLIEAVMSNVVNRLTLFVSLLLALFLTSVSWGQNIRLEQFALPSRQEVYLRIDPGEENYRGRTTIALSINKPTQTITLHAQDIDIEKVELRQGTGLRSLVIEKEIDSKVTFGSHSLLTPGQYEMTLVFSAPFNRNSVGLYKFFDQGNVYLATQFEMTDARRCFPCFDEPSFKIPFQMTVEAPTGQKVFNNSPETKCTTIDGWTRHEFAQTPPIPSYLVALAVGPYEETPVPELSVPGRIITPKGKIRLAEFAQNVTPDILAALEAYFGTTYPYEKLDQVALSEFPFGAMENAGLVTYREDVLLINAQTAQQSTVTRASIIIAHELAHQWFGNLVTMKWWDDLWLNEAFATWIASKVVNDLYPELEYILHAPQNNVMTADANLSSKPIRKPIKTENDIMDGLGLAYSKGGAVLNMVEKWIGEQTFQKGVRNYLQVHRFGNAAAADLWNALGRVSGKDVPAVLESFTEQSGFPLLTFRCQGRTLTIEQRRFVTAGVDAPSQTWTLPVFVRYGRAAQVKSQTVVINSASNEVELDFQPEWLFPDDGALGYFRWEMSGPELSALLARKSLLSDREKLALLHNVEGLFTAGTLSPADLLGSLEQFLTDPHPSVVDLALDTMSQIAWLYLNENNRSAWNNYLAQALEPVIERFALTPKSTDSAKIKELRTTLLTLMARDLKDASLIATAKSQAERYLLASANVDPALAPTYLKIAARNGDVELVERVKTALAESSDPQRRNTLLNTLGMFGPAPAQERAMDLMLSDTVTASDLRYLLDLNAEEESRRRRLQSWIEKNFSALKLKMPAAFVAYIPASMSSARDDDQLAAIKKLFGRQNDPNDTIKRELVKIEEKIKVRIATIKRGQKSFDHYLSDK